MNNIQKLKHIVESIQLDNPNMTRENAIGILISQYFNNVQSTLKTCEYALEDLNAHSLSDKVKNLTK